MSKPLSRKKKIIWFAVAGPAIILYLVAMGAFVVPGWIGEFTTSRAKKPDYHNYTPKHAEARREVEKLDWAAGHWTSTRTFKLMTNRRLPNPARQTFAVCQLLSLYVPGRLKVFLESYEQGNQTARCGSDY